MCCKMQKYLLAVVCLGWCVSMGSAQQAVLRVRENAALPGPPATNGAATRHRHLIIFSTRQEPVSFTIREAPSAEEPTAWKSLWMACCTLLRKAATFAVTALSSAMHLQSPPTEGVTRQSGVATRKLQMQVAVLGPPLRQSQAIGAASALPLLAVDVPLVSPSPALRGVSAAALMMVAGLSWPKHRQQQLSPVPAPGCLADTDLSSDVDGGMVVDALDISLASEEADSTFKPHCSGTAADQDTPQLPRQLLAGRHGWLLSSSFTSPRMGRLDNKEVRFGVLLGEGSTGRVYRGVWAGADVAVKLMHHDTTGVHHQQRYMQQLVTLDHANVVRTMCGVTFTRAGATTVSAAQQHQTVHFAQPDTHMPHKSNQHNQHNCLKTLQQQQQQQEGMGAVAGASLQAPLTPADSPFTPPAHPNFEAETWLLQEYCNLGSLSKVALDWQAAGETDLQMYERLSLLRDAAQGLKYLHTNNMVHGDLNASNVLICRHQESPVRMIAKVADMCVSSLLKRQGRQSVRVLSHVAPEVQRGGCATAQSDIYAFGIMMWEVYSAQTAYRKLLGAAHLYEAAVIQNLRPMVPAGMPADYQLLMERCWASDPSDRPSADKLAGCLSVMAAERHRRLNPGANLAPLATPAAAAAVAAAAVRSSGGRLHTSLLSSGSWDQATLQLLLQQQAFQSPHTGAPTSQLWRQGSCGATLPSRPPSAAHLAPGMGGGLLHHSSCPAKTFEALLRSNSLLTQSRSSRGSDASDTDQVDSADAMCVELQEEEEMLEQLRAGSQTQSGPGSAPVLHRCFSGGHDMLSPLLGNEHTWHI